MELSLYQDTLSSTMQEMTLKETSNDRPTPGTLVWHANKQSPPHTLMQTQRDYSKHQLTCVWNGRLRECHSGLLKRLFASFHWLELNNSDRNQPIMLVILIYSKLHWHGTNRFQHDIKLSSSFTSFLGSCRLKWFSKISLLISKRLLREKRQNVTIFLLVNNNVSEFYHTIPALV